MTPYVDMDLGKHMFKLWRVAWRHQAITRTSVGISSVKSCGIHGRASSQKDLKLPVTKIASIKSWSSWEQRIKHRGQLNHKNAMIISTILIVHPMNYDHHECVLSSFVVLISIINSLWINVTYFPIPSIIASLAQGWSCTFILVTDKQYWKRWV